MKKLIALSLVTLFLLAGCAGAELNELNDSYEDPVMTGYLDVRFEGGNTCTLYNTKTGEDLVTTEQEGFYQGCGIVNTYANKVYYSLDPDGMGGYGLFGYASLWNTYHYDAVTGETGEIAGDIISFSEDGRYAAIKEVAEDANRIAVLDLKEDSYSYFVISEEYLQFGNTKILNDGQTLVYGAAVGDPSDEKVSIIVQKADEDPLELISMSSEWYSVTYVDGETVYLHKQITEEERNAECRIQIDGSDLTCQD